MSDLSINTEGRYKLNGQQLNAPIGWSDIRIKASYEGDNTQPSLDIEEFTFPLEARDIVNKWISDGLINGVGIFEGMPFDITLFNNQAIQHSFKSFIDFTNGYKDFKEDGKVSVSVIRDNSLDAFFDRLGGTSYGYLEEIGVITSSNYVDVSYVVEKKFNLFEILMSSIVLYLMVKELAVAIEMLANATADVAGLSLGGSVFPPTAALGAALLAVLKALLILAYVVVLLAAVIELSKTLFEILIPPQRNHKAISLREALKVVCNYLGYGFVSPITEMDDVHYLPSNPNLDEKTAGGFISVTKGTQSGIPNVLDYGYICEDMFQLCKDLFNAKLSIIGNDVHLRSKNDPFWVQQSTWTLPNVLINTLEYNTDDMKSERLLSFSIDTNDEWTIDNYLGTAYEIKTDPLTILRERAVLLKGLDDVKFQGALGNRKDELNGIESFLSDVAGSIDAVIGFFGGSTTFSDKIEARLGDLKQSNNWHTIPKLLYLKGSNLPLNHREIWNAKILYEKYHEEKSFVLNNRLGQKIYYKGVEVPFGFEDYKQLLDNSYFKYKGDDAKIMSFDWTIGDDKAVIDFWVRKIYTNNLKETYIYPK